VDHSNTMKLFPHVLIRLSGGGFEHMETLNLNRSYQLVNQIRIQEKKLEELKETISMQLYEIISEKEDPKIQNLVLTLRRKVFKGRNITPKDRENVFPHLPGELANVLEEYSILIDKIKQDYSGGEEIFTEEISLVRKNLHALAEEETLQKGLLLSSQSLLKRIPAYTAKEGKLNKKNMQTERGLMKYISRMYGKTSPFSTFTNLVMGKPVSAEDNGTPFLRLENQTDGDVVYHIRLNNFLYSYLKNILCKNPEIYRHFLIRPNPTLEVGKDYYLFLTNNDNIEAFQRIPANPVLEVFRQLTLQEKEGMAIREVIQTIIENEYIDAPAEDLEAYIVQLVDYGFLEYNIGVSGIDPDWDIKLLDVLEGIVKSDNTVPLLPELIDTLKLIRQLANRYGESPCNERNGILEDAFRQFRAICMKLHEAAGLPEEERKTPEERQKEAREKKKAEEEAKKQQDSENQEESEETSGDNKEESPEPEEEVFKHKSNTQFIFKSEQMFYEDTTVNITPMLDEAKLEEFIGSLHRLLQQMRHYEGYSDEREKMKHFFVDKYGSDGVVDLMTFYEEFYREFKKPEAELQSKRDILRNRQRVLQEVKEQKEKDQKEKEQKEKEQKEIEQKELEQKENTDEKKAGELERLEQELKKLSDEINEKTPYFAIPSIKEKQDKNKEWNRSLEEAIRESVSPGYDEVAVDFGHVEKAHRSRPVNMGHHDGQCSYGSFIQFYTETQPDGNEKLMGVVNSTFPGFGKLFSRFMHIFDRGKTDDLRHWNDSLSGGALLVEDCDASYFNANLHPPLLPFEIRIPGGHNTLPSENQIPITELKVGMAEAGDRLKLIHGPTGKRAYVLDLGFQGHKGRSQLFQLLEKFSKVQYLFSMPVASAASTAAAPEKKEDAHPKSEENAEPEAPEVEVTPRVVYEDQIVLKRKSWSVPVELLPFREPNETQWQYYLRVNRWRQELELPEEVFVYVVDRVQRSPGQNQKARAKQAPTRDDYKPQYISFKSPFLIDLFERIIKRVAYGLKVVEMLPDSNQLLKVGSKKHIAEFTVQWYTYNRDHDASGKAGGE
jgi:lantibiotic biosynthesis protein